MIAFIIKNRFQFIRLRVKKRASDEFFQISAYSEVIF